jgi:hypothetical protein
VAQNPPDRLRDRDRTTLVVRLGLLILLVVGVASVFGESLVGLIRPPPGDAPAPAQGSRPG